jgi:hypothetical protein
MPEFRRTKDRERVVHELAARYPYVLIRNKNLLWNPVRLRAKRIADAKPFIVRNPAPFNGELRRWNESGGLLLYDRAYIKGEDIATHHAQLLSECPPSMEFLATLTEHCRDLAVIFEPPTWDEHGAYIENVTPPAARCRKLYDLARAAKSDDRTARLGLSPCKVMARDELDLAMGLSKAQVTRTRSAIFRSRDWIEITRVITRMPPEREERALWHLYDHIVNRFPSHEGEYFIVGSGLRKFDEHWTMNLKMLERRGHVAVPPPLVCFFFQGAGPDFVRIQRDHESALGRLAEIRTFLEGLEAI